jgi:hypothetical protein
VTDDDQPTELDLFRADFLGWKANRAGTRIGFVTISFPDLCGLVFHDCPVYCNEGVLNVAPPDKPWVSQNGVKRYSVVVSFTRPEHKARWVAAVIAAIQRGMPQLLTGATP